MAELLVVIVVANMVITSIITIKVRGLDSKMEARFFALCRLWTYITVRIINIPYSVGPDKHTVLPSGYMIDQEEL